MNDSQPQQQISAALGRFIATFRGEDIPPAVRREAQRSLLNGFGAALGAARRPEVGLAIEVLVDAGATGTHRIIGRPERLDLLSAAMVNGIAINALDFDDTHLPTVIHPTAPVAPAVFALAQRTPISGKQAIDAFVLGVEVACRLGNAVSPKHYARGFHITATCGVIGAAAAGARILGLDPGQTVAALGNAATQAAGLVESLPTQAKSTSVGTSARNGLFAALLAARNWNGPDQPIEGRYGWARVLADAFDPGAAVNDLGATWELARNDYKPYPCGVVLNPVLDACLELRTRDGIDAMEIRGVEVLGHPLLGTRADRGVVSDGQTARLSIHHAVAVAFTFGRAGVAEFSDQAAADPAVRALAAKTRFTVEAGLGVESARVVVSLSDGSTRELLVEHARGSAKRPLSDAEIEAKTRGLARFGGAAVDVEALIAAIRELDGPGPARRVMEVAAVGK